MKRIVISIVILTCLAVLCVWSVVAVQNKTHSLIDKIHEVEKAFQSSDTDKCIAVAKELQDEWMKFMKRAVLVNDLGHALDITSSIAEIYSFAQEENEEIYASCDRAEVQIEIFEIMQTPTFWNVL